MTPKILGFKLECMDYNAFYALWRINRNSVDMPASHVEFGASPIRDRKSMADYMKHASNLGIEYHVFAIIQTSKKVA